MSAQTLGNDVTYSGTVTAAMEAAVGHPRAAVSLEIPEGNHSTGGLLRLHLCGTRGS